MNLENRVNQLILEGEKLSSTLIFKPIQSGSLQLYPNYKSKENDRYQKWKYVVERFLTAYYPSYIKPFKEVSHKLTPNNHAGILAILESIQEYPNTWDRPHITQEKKEGTASFPIVTPNLQLAYEFLWEAIRDELTGQQLKDIEHIIHYKEDDEQTLKLLIQYLSTITSDSIPRILARILMNPTVSQGLSRY